MSYEILDKDEALWSSLDVKALIIFVSSKYYNNIWSNILIIDNVSQFKKNCQNKIIK